MSVEVSHGHRSWQVHADGHLDATELARALDDVRAGGGGAVYVWVRDPTTGDDAVAVAAGLQPGREQYQLRVPLPLPDPGLSWRPFEPGRDEDAWLAVNNRAFAWHPEQGGWDRPMLERHLAEPWFDPAGFLLHERDGRLAGFCWTKVHPAGEADGDPALGEIYVIAVDPDFHGTGLGRDLTLAGLAWLHRERGTPVGMLYVDAANEAALGLYRKLGFTPHHTDRAYFSELSPGLSPG
jgi:mycothiol synthase